LANNQKLTKLAEARSCFYPGLLIHPALQLKVMIVEGYHRSRTPLFQITDGHPLSTVECRWQLYRLLHQVGYTKSLCTTHTVFALGLQPPLLLPALPPMKSSNLGIGEAEHINATSKLQASFNTAGLTGIAELSGSLSIHSTHQLALIVELLFTLPSPGRGSQWTSSFSNF